VTICKWENIFIVFFTYWISWISSSTFAYSSMIDTFALGIHLYRDNNIGSAKNPTLAFLWEFCNFENQLHRMDLDSRQVCIGCYDIFHENDTRSHGHIEVHNRWLCPVWDKNLLGNGTLQCQLNSQSTGYWGRMEMGDKHLGFLCSKIIFVTDAHIYAHSYFPKHDQYTFTQR